MAVSCKDYVEKIKEMLGGRACDRRVHEVSKTGACILKESVSAYIGKLVFTQQAGFYAQGKLKWFVDSQPLPFVYESTGILTRFYGYEILSPALE